MFLFLKRSGMEFIFVVIFIGVSVGEKSLAVPISSQGSEDR